MIAVMCMRYSSHLEYTDGLGVRTSRSIIIRCVGLHTYCNSRG